MTEEDRRKAVLVEKTPNDKLSYEIIPVQSGGMGP